MASHVYANGRSIVHAGDGQTVSAGAPDVCKTPGPSGPTPVPYPNVARTTDLAQGTRKVKIEGHAVAIEGAKLRTSTGDEAGSVGGLISGKTKGALSWGVGSLNVRFEGKGVVRFLDATLNNGNASNSSGASPGGNYLMPPQDPNTACLHCGKTFDEHVFAEILPSTGVYDEAIEKYRKKHDAHTVGGLSYGAGRVSDTLLAYAGQMPGWLNARDPIFNFKSGLPIPLEDDDSRQLERGPNRFAVGNCVEQKVLHQAWLTGPRSFPSGCTLRMGVGNNVGGRAGAERSKKQLKKGMLAPCFTCREIMMAMLCQNKANPKRGGQR